MKKLTTKERDHIMKLIRDEVEFFNGWSVGEYTVKSACFKAACKIENYLIRKAKREGQNKQVKR